MRLLTSGLLCVLLSLAAAAESKVVTILHTNDLHGALLPVASHSPSSPPPAAGAARVAAVLAAERASAEREGRAVLLLDAGDFFHGSPEGNASRGQAVLAFMNHVRYDALALGNHEWAYGEKALRDLRASSKFEWVACNVTRVDPAADTAPIVEYAKPWVVLSAGSVKVAVVGFTAPGTPDMNLPEHVAGLDFLPYQRQGAYYLRQARAAGADVVVALSHLGSGADASLAKKAPGWDLIVGGHDHRAFPSGFEESGTLIVQAGSGGEFVGRVDLTWDTSTRKVTSRTARLIAVDASWKPDPAAEEVIRPWIREGFDEKVGTTSGLLTRAPPDSPLGCLVADAIRVAADSDAALVNSGGIRADLPQGAVTRRDVYMAAPFEDDILVFSLSGADLRELLDGAFREGRLSYPVSGLKFAVDAKKPAGQRVLGLHVGADALDPARTYTLATTRFAAARLADDSVTRRVMAPGGTMRSSRQAETGMQEALLKMFEGGIVVVPPEGGRVEFVKRR